MKVKVQVVTITDDGQESMREVACIEREDLTPETLGLSLAEGKTLLRVAGNLVRKYTLSHKYLFFQRY